MKKIEIIWRELLFQGIEKNNPPSPPRLRSGLRWAGRRFTQKDLAKKFNFSTSTVFQALKIPRKMGAVRVTGRNFTLEDPEKLLYHWASVRNLKKDIIFSGRVNLPVLEIEGRMPPDVTFGGFSSARQTLGEPPADYDRVYVYARNADQVKKRFKFEKAHPRRDFGGQGRKNVIVLKADEFLAGYGQTTTLAQTFVDLWNLPDWYAKEFVKALKEKIDGLLP